VKPEHTVRENETDTVTGRDVSPEDQPLANDVKHSGPFTAETSRLLGSRTRFQVGNTAAVRYPDSVTRRRNEIPENLKQDLAQLRDGLIADQGGLSELTQVTAVRITRLVSLEACLRQLENNLLTEGIFTETKRIRRAVYDRYLRTIIAQRLLLNDLGSARVARPVTFEEFVRGE
jgi:hypothetical protein